jgi:hypothetical protein
MCAALCQYFVMKHFVMAVVALLAMGCVEAEPVERTSLSLLPSGLWDCGCTRCEPGPGWLYVWKSPGGTAYTQPCFAVRNAQQTWAQLPRVHWPDGTLWTGLEYVTWKAKAPASGAQSFALYGNYDYTCSPNAGCTGITHSNGDLIEQPWPTAFQLGSLYNWHW